MSDNFYSASLSRTQGRNTWAVIFRHPKRTDPTTGKEGLRVRQSLKTDNDGTTGAGKTTLLRQRMGTDPAKDRFPSSSTAKTTVHETEVILQEGPYCAVVTFFPMEDVREHLSWRHR